MTRLINFVAGWKGYALLAAVCLAVGFSTGWTVRDWKASADHLGDFAKKIRTVEKVVYRERRQADATASIEARSVADQTRIRTVTQTIIKEVPVYVSPETDTRFALPVGLVRLHDAAATGHPVSEPAGELDGAAGNAEPSEVPPSRLGLAIVENYGICLADQARFRDLQEWVRTQQALANSP